MKKEKTIICVLTALILVGILAFWFAGTKTGFFKELKDNIKHVQTTPIPTNSLSAQAPTEIPTPSPTPNPTPAPTHTPGPSPAESGPAHERYGAFGRLYIRDWSVALLDETGQTIAEMEDSASCTTINGMLLITDKGEQGLDIIRDIIEGEVCTIRNPGGMETAYVCDRIDPEGKLEEGKLLGGEGELALEAGYDMIVYVENDDSENITITYWIEID